MFNRAVPALSLTFFIACGSAGHSPSSSRDDSGAPLPAIDAGISELDAALDNDAARDAETTESDAGPSDVGEAGIGCAQEPCGPGLRCVDNPASTTGYTCLDVDGCLGVFCDAGQACEDRVAPLDGHRCVEVDGCAGQTCGSGTSCVDSPSPAQGFSCQDIDACASDPCASGTRCVDLVAPASGYVCTEIDGCLEAQCGAGMHCLDLPASQTGYVCEETDACSSNPCGAGFDCVDEPAPSVGFQCIDSDGCEEGVCSPGTTCEDVAAPGIGHVCTDDDGCVDVQCEAGLTCYDEPAPKTGHGCLDPYDLLYKWLPAAESYETLFDFDVPQDEMAALTQSWGDQGFVVTAAYAVGSANTLIAARPSSPGSLPAFDTQVVAVKGDWQRDASELGAAGYLVTAMLDSPRILIGTRPRGSDVRFDVWVFTPTGAGLKNALEYLQAGGYFVSTTGATNGFVLIGTRPRGSSLRYDLRAEQVKQAASLASMVTAFGADGYIITSANTTKGTTLYTQFGARPRGTNRAYDASASIFFDGATLEAMGSSGLIITGAGRDGSFNLNRYAWGVGRPQ